MLRRDYHLFELARIISRTSSYKRIKIGCIITDKHKIISAGVNKCKSHPIQKMLNIKYYKSKFKSYKFRHCLHAEIDAVLNSGNKDLSGLSVYIYRENIYGEKEMCRPCPACMKVLKDKGIKKIFYTTKDGYTEEDITN